MKIQAFIILTVLCSFSIEVSSQELPKLPIKRKKIEFTFDEQEHWYLDIDLKPELEDGFRYYFKELHNVDTLPLTEGLISRDSIYVQIGGTFDHDKQYLFYSLNSVYIHDATIKDYYEFDNLETNTFIQFDSCTFKNETYFLGGRFHNAIAFFDCHFEKSFDLGSTEFKNSLFLVNCDFQSEAKLSGNFSNNLDLSHSNFSKNTLFDYATLRDTIFLNDTQFSESIDFRLATVDSLDAFFLDGTQYKEGNLKIRWASIRKSKNYRIQIYRDLEPRGTSYQDRKYDFLHLDKIYKKLARNYKAQNDLKASNDINHELEIRRSSLIGGVWNKIYGLTFGFGYEPWRFIILIIVMVILMSFVYLKFFFKEAKQSLFAGEPDASSAVVEHSLPRMMITLKYSAWIFFSIKFHRNWIHFGNKNFVILNVIHWLAGIATYILFAILVKNNRFEFLKDVLGF